MKDIAIFGAGGFGKEVACLINSINDVKPTWNFIGFFDDGKDIGEQVSHFGKVLGGVSELLQYANGLSVVIAIGNPNTVYKIVSVLNHNENLLFPNLIHPQVNFSDIDSLEMGIGNIVQRGSSFSCDINIGDFNVINANVAFGHDDNIGSYNTFMPGVKISGEVRMADSNFFGVGSIVLQQIRIGNNIRLGAGSVLMTKPKDSTLYIGNPAKKFQF